jgi:hypothetical protein
MFVQSFNRANLRYEVRACVERGREGGREGERERERMQKTTVFAEGLGPPFDRRLAAL